MSRFADSASDGAATLRHEARKLTDSGVVVLLEKALRAANKPAVPAQIKADTAWMMSAGIGIMASSLLVAKLLWLCRIMSRDSPAKIWFCCDTRDSCRADALTSFPSSRGRKVIKISCHLFGKMSLRQCMSPKAWRSGRLLSSDGTHTSMLGVVRPSCPAEGD